MAENLELRREEVAQRLSTLTGLSKEKALQEVDLSIQRLFYWGAYCDKYGGTVQVSHTSEWNRTSPWACNVHINKWQPQLGTIDLLRVVITLCLPYGSENDQRSDLWRRPDQTKAGPPSGGTARTRGPRMTPAPTLSCLTGTLHPGQFCPSQSPAHKFAVPAMFPDLPVIF